MSLKKTLFKNTSYNMASYGVLLLASFFSIPIIIASLGNSLYGVLVLLVSAVPLMATLDLGLPAAVIRKLSLPSSKTFEKNQVWQTSLFLFIFLGGLIFFSSLIIFFLYLRAWPALSALDKQTYNQAAIIVSLILFVNHLSNHYLTLPQAQQKFEIYNIRTLIVGLGNSIGSAYVAYLTQNILAILLLQLSLHLLSTAILVIYSRRHFPRHSYPRLYPSTARKLIAFGIKNFIGKAANQLQNQFSKYSLSFLPASFIPAFSIPQVIVVNLAGGISQLALAFFPMSASLLEKQKINKLKRAIIFLELGILILGVIQVFAVFSFAKPLLFWWLKDLDLAVQATPVLKVFSFYFLLTTLTPIPTVILDSINHPQVPSFFAVLTTSITIILILILTPSYGILGPAYAAVISSLITIPSFLAVFAFKFYRFYQKITSSR